MIAWHSFQEATKKLTLQNITMNRGWIRKLIGGLSFGSALFIFQACYGTPQDMKPDMLVEGTVKSASSGLPVKGIKVSVPETGSSQITGEDGKYSLWTLFTDSTRISFEDTDLAADGAFLKKDTLIAVPQERVQLNMILSSK